MWIYRENDTPVNLDNVNRITSYRDDDAHWFLQFEFNDNQYVRYYFATKKERDSYLDGVMEEAEAIIISESSGSVVLE